MGICRYCALAPTTRGRELTESPSFPSFRFLLTSSFSLPFSLSPPTRRIYSVALLQSLSFLSFSRLSFVTLAVVESSVQDAQPAAGPCVISGAIPYSVPTMICSRLVPRSRWISFIGVRVCPTSIYRRGVSCTGYSQRYKDPEEVPAVAGNVVLTSKFFARYMKILRYKYVALLLNI